MIFVPEDLIRDREMTDMDVATWCLCNIVSNSPIKDSDLITVTQVAYQIHNTFDINHGIKADIGVSIQHLLEENYIVGQRQGKQYYEIFQESFNMEVYEYFIKVDENAIRKIFKHLRPFAVLRTYLLILTTINPKTKCSTWNKEQLAELIDKNPNTITRYNKFLEDEHLLYIYRSKPTAKLRTNIYSRYEDRESAKNYGDQRSEGKQQAISANEKRRYTQMYNAVKAGKKTYSPEEMQELWEYCKAENVRRQKIYAKNPSYDQKLFDLTYLKYCGIVEAK